MELRYRQNTQTPAAGIAQALRLWTVPDRGLLQPIPALPVAGFYVLSIYVQPEGTGNISRAGIPSAACGSEAKANPPGQKKGSNGLSVILLPYVNAGGIAAGARLGRTSCNERGQTSASTKSLTAPEEQDSSHTSAFGNPKIMCSTGSRAREFSSLSLTTDSSRRRAHTLAARFWAGN